MGVGDRSWLSGLVRRVQKSVERKAGETGNDTGKGGGGAKGSCGRLWNSRRLGKSLEYNGQSGERQSEEV